MPRMTMRSSFQMSHVVETQEPVLALLAEPATHGGAEVKRVDTHAAAPAVDPAPWIEAIGAYIEEHLIAFGETPDVFPREEVAELAQMSHAAYDRIQPLLVERGRQGLIRRIHGDLHLGNIVLLDG